MTVVICGFIGLLERAGHNEATTKTIESDEECELCARSFRFEYKGGDVMEYAVSLLAAYVQNICKNRTKVNESPAKRYPVPSGGIFR